MTDKHKRGRPPVPPVPVWVPETWHQMKVRHLEERLDIIAQRKREGRTRLEAARDLGMTVDGLSMFLTRYGTNWSKL